MKNSRGTQLNICASECQLLFGTLFASILCSGTDYVFFCVQFWTNLQQNLVLNLASIFKEIKSERTPSNSAIWDEFSEQH